MPLLLSTNKASVIKTAFLSPLDKVCSPSLPPSQMLIRPNQIECLWTENSQNSFVCLESGPEETGFWGDRRRISMTVRSESSQRVDLAQACKAAERLLVHSSCSATHFCRDAIFSSSPRSLPAFNLPLCLKLAQ
ncbi:UNVERIFIED_CONTAM: hypothetical protein K2H54_036687 [Gekko kuhli]